VEGTVIVIGLISLLAVVSLRRTPRFVPQMS
jgi:hypothetical protein